MAHRHPIYAFFTNEVCKRGILREPFRLIDVGVIGGIAEYWWHLGDHLEVWGFDVLSEGIEPLIETNEHPERLHYFNFGLGDRDGTQAFKIHPDNPTESHFAASNQTDTVDESWQSAPIRQLDSLVADGTIGPIDFMKMDAENHEIEIVKGAQQFFQTSGIFGVESETRLFRNKRNPRSHFVELYELLGRHGFSPYDAGPHRVPRPPLVHGFPRETEDGEFVLEPIGSTPIFDFLFLNEAFDETSDQADLSVDRLIKMIVTTELYCLQDVGLDILFANGARLGRRFDIEEAANWLVRERKHSKLTYQQYRGAMTASEKPESRDGPVIVAPVGHPLRPKSYGPTRQRLSGDAVLYISTSGDDASPGRSPRQPLRTLNEFYRRVRNEYDIAGHNLAAQLADGEYQEDEIACVGATIGAVQIYVQGNESDPSAVTIRCSGRNLFLSRDLGTTTLRHLTLGTTARQSRLVDVGAFSTIVLDRVSFEAAPEGIHIFVCQGYLVVQNNYSILGGAARHLSVSENGVVYYGAFTVEVPRPIAFEDFVVAESGALITSGGSPMRFEGEGVAGCSGRKFTIVPPGRLFSSATDFPGDQPGTIAPVTDDARWHN